MANGYQEWLAPHSYNTEQRKRKATLRHTPRTQNTQEADKFSKAWIYELRCKDCPLQYIGYTGPTFPTRFKGHIRAIQNNQDTSRYTQHILNTRHSFITIDDTVEIIETAKKTPRYSHQ